MDADKFEKDIALTKKDVDNIITNCNIHKETENKLWGELNKLRKQIFENGLSSKINVIEQRVKTMEQNFSSINRKIVGFFIAILLMIVINIIKPYVTSSNNVDSIVKALEKNNIIMETIQERLKSNQSKGLGYETQE